MTFTWLNEEVGVGRDRARSRGLYLGVAGVWEDHHIKQEHLGSLVSSLVNYFFIRVY